MKKTFQNTYYLTAVSLLVAIELIVGLVPYIGYIPLNPALNVTIIHIPVIIGAVVLGHKAGGLLGFFFGLTSLINATFLRPNPIESPIFSPFFSGGAFKGGWQSLLICFVPRILVGVVAGLLFAALKKTKLPRAVSLALCGIAGSLVNTLLVMAGIWVFYREPYAAAYGMTLDGLYKAILGVIALNGTLEAVAAAIVTVLVGGALLRLKKRL